MTKSQQGKLRELQTSQLTVSEIAAELNCKKSDVRKALFELGYKPIESKEPAESEFLKGKKPVEIPKRSYRRITPDVERRICELREQCFTCEQIKNKLNICSSESVRQVLIKNGYSTKRGQYHKITKEEAPEMTIKEVFEDIDKTFGDFSEAVDEMIPEERKEPAPAATDTSSEQDITPVIPDTNNSTEPPKSQALTGIGGLNTIEGALDEWLGNEAEIVAVYANKGQAELTFVYAGQEYIFSFGQKGVPEYDGTTQY